MHTDAASATENDGAATLNIGMFIKINLKTAQY